MIGSFRIMVGFRLLYAGAIILCLVTGRPELSVEFSIPFLISLVIPYLGRKEPDYYLVDSCFCSLFTIAMGFSYFYMWPTTFSLFSIDKIFHLFAGFCLASFGGVYYRSSFYTKAELAATVVVFALAIGAGWEIFEWLLSVLPARISVPSTGYEDTIQDLIADAVGGLISAVFFASRPSPIKKR